MLASLACARCFGELFWDAAFGSNFEEQLWGTILGEQFCGFVAALTNNSKHLFLRTMALGSSFRKQLWNNFRGSFSSFGEQLSFGEHPSGAVLENSFGESLWGTGLRHSHFGVTTLQRCFGEQLWEASENRFGEQLWPAFRNNFAEQLLWRTAALGSSCQGQLYKQLRRVFFGSNFGVQVSWAALQHGFGEPFWQTGLQNRSFGEQLWGNSFGEQRRGIALGSCFRVWVLRTFFGMRVR